MWVPTHGPKGTSKKKKKNKGERMNQCKSITAVGKAPWIILPIYGWSPVSFMFIYEELFIIILCLAKICYTEVQITTCVLNV